MSRKRPAEEVIDFDLDGPGSAPSGGGNDGGPSNGGRRRRVGAAAAGWGLAEVLAECGLDPAAGKDDDGAFVSKGDRPERGGECDAVSDQRGTEPAMGRETGRTRLRLPKKHGSPPQLTQTHSTPLAHHRPETSTGDGVTTHDDLGCRLLPDVSPASLRSGISSLLSEMDR